MVMWIKSNFRCWSNKGWEGCLAFLGSRLMSALTDHTRRTRRRTNTDTDTKTNTRKGGERDKETKVVKNIFLSIEKHVKLMSALTDHTRRKRRGREVLRKRWSQGIKSLLKRRKLRFNVFIITERGLFQLEECGLWTSKRYLGKHLVRLSTGELAAEHRTSMFCSPPSLNIYVLQFGILLCSEDCKRKTALT